MTDDHFPLILDFVEWIDKQPRRYSDVMEAWRTSCPRLPVWEDAVDMGYVERQHKAGGGEWVKVTDKGQQLLIQNGRLTPFVSTSSETGSRRGFCE